MERKYVERRDNSFYLIGSRVPIARLVREFDRGESPEAIRSHYPALSLEQVYGAIAFYLAHKSEVNHDVAERDRVEAEYSPDPLPQELLKKLGRAKADMLARP